MPEISIDLASLGSSRGNFAVAEGLPPAVYSDAEFHRFEMEAVFGSEWLCVGRQEQIPEPGDYLSVIRAGEPLIIVRGNDGAISAMSAVCQHRGMCLTADVNRGEDDMFDPPNLISGISNAANMRPHKDPNPTKPTHLNPGGRAIRAWILVSDDDSFDRILDAAARLGATILWRDHYWTEFGGCNASFVDPWGNQIMLWAHLEGAETDDDTHEVVGDFKLPKGWTYE